MTTDILPELPSHPQTVMLTVVYPFLNFDQLISHENIFITQPAATLCPAAALLRRRRFSLGHVISIFLSRNHMGSNMEKIAVRFPLVANLLLRNLVKIGLLNNLMKSIAFVSIACVPIHSLL